ncbi:MAG: hypothetical protein PVS2B3_03660 [Steroidobacteraceae bacterium]
MPNPYVRAGRWTRYCEAMRKLGLNFLAAAGLAAGVYGCGSDKNPGAAAAAANPVHKMATQPDSSLSPGMVAAVTPPGAAPGAVQVKFELQGRPDVAQPLDVDVVIVPRSGNVDRISGKFSADEGLELVSGQELPAADKPVEGTPIHHSVTVLPKRDGIFTLTAVLTLDSAGRSTNETYSMPVIAGAGLPDAPARGTSAVPEAAPHPAAAAQ